MQPDLSRIHGCPVESVLAHGAVPDGVALNTEAVQRAVDTAAARGGGLAYVPPGTFRIGGVELRSRVTLWLEAGAVLVASTDRKDYSRDFLLYAEDTTSTTVGGRGVIDGLGFPFWVRSGQYWVEGEWRPRALLRAIACRDLHVEGVTFRNSPAWTVHPTDCDGLYVRGITIRNPFREAAGPNTDGINPDGCSNVRISDCDLECGDDAIVLKITRQSRTRTCANVVVTNCILKTTESALKIGSETCGEFRNIVFSNCVIEDAGAGFTLQMRDGGTIDGVTISNLAMSLRGGCGGTPIYFWSHRRTDETPWGTVRNVLISDVVATGGGTVFISGPAECPIERVTLQNLRLTTHREPLRWEAEERSRESHQEEPPYPFIVHGFRMTTRGMFCRNVTGLRLQGVHLTWGEPEDPAWGAALRCWHARDVEVDGLTARQALGSAHAAVELRDVRGAFLHNCRALKDTATFLQVEGQSESITVMGNDLSQAAEAVRLGEGVPGAAVCLQGNREPLRGS